MTCIALVKKPDIVDLMEYIVHGSKNQIDSNFTLLWSEFVERNATFRSEADRSIAFISTNSLQSKLKITINC